MASIEYRKTSIRVIAYMSGRKQAFNLGKVSKKTAQRFEDKIDTLIHERRCNLPLSREVSSWLAGLDDQLYDLLTEVELAEPRERAGSLAKFISDYIDRRTDVSEARIGKFENARDRIVEFFGDVSLKKITPGDADDYSRWLLTKMAPTTAHKECQIATQFFRMAYRKALIERNPFEGVTIGKATNNARRVFVARDVIERVLEACPDWQWRLVLALARYGGLRCPSEIAPLKWSDINWDTERFTVSSPKTERYGKESRIVPLFPELRPFLDEAYFRDDAHRTWVVPMLAGNSRNLGTKLKKIIERAGVEPWPKLYQNCRASRQTELEQQFPTYVVCSWLGNTPTVAHKHYLTLTDDHFQEAVKTVSKPGGLGGMHVPAVSRKEPQRHGGPVQEVTKTTVFADLAEIFDRKKVAEEGFEPPTRGL